MYCAGLEEKEEEVEGEDMELLKDDAACCFTGHAGMDKIRASEIGATPTFKDSL